MKESLGLIETIGLTAGIEAADAAVKSANVKLVGYELTRGSGMTTIKIEGDVGAVKAAVEAGAAAAARVGQVVSTLVIPRPSAGLEGMIRNKNTVGFAKAEKAVKKGPEAAPKEKPAEGKKRPAKRSVPKKPVTEEKAVPVEIKQAEIKPAETKKAEIKPSEKKTENLKPAEDKKAKTEPEIKPAKIDNNKK